MQLPLRAQSDHVDFAPEVIIDEGGTATYDRSFMSPREADELLAHLIEKTAWTQEFLRIYGRRIPFPRLTAWYGDAGATYKYSGIVNKPLGWTKPLIAVRKRLLSVTGVRFNGVLLNYYRSGADSQGWHADDERELGQQPLIASVSLGATRTFELKSKEKNTVISLPLEHGSLLLMGGPMQERWLHRVPKERAVRSPRINLTFRVIDATCGETPQR